MGIVQDWNLETGSRVVCFYSTRNEKITIGVVVHITDGGMVDVLIPESEKPIRFSKQGEKWGASDYIWRPFIKQLTPESELKALQQKATNVMAELVRKGVALDKDRIEKLLELLEGVDR